MRHRSLTALSLPLAVLVMAGCGGGDDSSEPTPTVASEPTPSALSKDELLTDGDAVCAEVNAAVGAIQASGTESEGQAGQVADLYVGMVESLKRLGTPEEEDGYAEFSAAADELSQAEGEVKLAAERGDSAALAGAETSGASALEAFRSTAASYGFEDCAEGPSAPASGETEPPAIEPESSEEALEEAAPEEEAPEEEAPETGGAGSAEEGGGANPGGGTGGGTEGGGSESSGGIGPG